MTFRLDSIKQLTKGAPYSVTIGWGFLEQQLQRYQESYDLDLDPDFQRGHVWSDEKRIRYVEYVLRGGKSSLELQFNCPRFSNQSIKGVERPDLLVLVDGKQRLMAARMFLADHLPAFGHTLSEYEDRQAILAMTGPRFTFHVNDLHTRSELLQWYLDLNDGGVVHDSAEIARVRELHAAAVESESATPVVKPPLPTPGTLKL